MWLGLRKKIAVSGAIIAIIGILVVYPGYYIVYNLTIRHLPLKTGTVLPDDYVAFLIEWPYGDGRYEYIFFASNNVNFASFHEKYYEDFLSNFYFQQGKLIMVYHHIENTTFGESWVQGGPEGDPFYIVFVNRGESSVTIELAMSFVPNYAPLVTLAGLALLAVGVIIGVAGLILKPNVWELKRKAAELEKKGKLEEAKQLYWKTISMGFPYVFPYERLRIIYAKQGDLKGAIKACEAYANIPGYDIKYKLRSIRYRVKEVGYPDIK